jgi:uncharacterized membrane protein
MTFLDDAEEHLQAGDTRRARKTLERARTHALLARNTDELERILELAGRLAKVDKGRGTQRLLYATTQNLRFLQRTSPGAAAQAPAPSSLTAPSSLDLNRALASVDIAARNLEVTIQRAITVAAEAAARPRPAPVSASTPVPTQPVAAPTPPPPSRPPKPPKPPREIDWSMFLGARGLAWAGGLVTILGIVFFFVLAANRGWLTPEIRIALGTSASVAVFSAGLWVKRRFGHLYAALAAVSAGIAGAYATLLAATALYEFVPQFGALVAAAAIAAVGVAVSLAWSEQMVAGLGLIGAMLVPLMILVDEGELSFVGTCFVAIVLAGTAVVAIRKHWRELLLLGGGASLVQIAVLIEETSALEWRLVALSVAFWFLYLGAGLIWQLRFARRGLEPVAGTLIITGGALAAYACSYLLVGTTHGAHHEAIGLFIVAAVYAALAVSFFGRTRTRDLSSLLWAIAAVLGAVAAGELFAGPSLTAVWGAVAVLLAWVAVRTGEERLFLPAFAYLVLSIGYVVAVEAIPDALFVSSTHPAAGALSAAFAAGALLLFALLTTRPLQPVRESGFFAVYLSLAVDQVRALGRVYVWSAGTLLLYAASLALLELFVRVDSFEDGHVALAGLWAAVALALVEAGLRLPRPDLQVGGFALLAFGIAEAAFYDLAELSTTVWSLSFLALASGALLVGFEFGRLSRMRERLYPAGAAILLSALLAAVAVVSLAHGEWRGISSEGAALLGLGLVYGAFSLPVFRSQRDLSTLLWALGLLLGIAGGAELLSGRWLVLAGALLCAGLSLLARQTRELRLQAASALVFALSLGYALVVEAPPRELFQAVAHPGAGVPALLFLAAAAGVSALVTPAGIERVRLAAREPLEAERLFGWLAGEQPLWRASGAWVAGTLLLYAASLALLELFVRVDSFEDGHVALAGLWAAVALALVEAGLRLPRPDLQVGGFALLAFGIAEAAFYDLAELSTTVWSLSFLALASGALLVGFEFGRLSRMRERLYPAGAAILLSALLAAVAVVSLAHGEWRGISSEGAALLGLGLVYGAFSLPVFRSQRDLSTLLWALGLLLGIAGGAELLSGRWLVLAGALLCAGLSLLARQTRELRLQAASALVFALSLGYALVVEAPPRELFQAVAHPGAGVPALLFLAAAAGVFALGPKLYQLGRLPVFALVGVLLFHAVSLLILELAELASDADVDTKFQRGHTGVSAFWGLISLAFLYLGLRRRSRALRLAGFALFGITLAKIFLYDLAFLSSLARALSFLAVGAVLLLAGFFYQRISDQFDERDGKGSPTEPPGNVAA